MSRATMAMLDSLSFPEDGSFGPGAQWSTRGARGRVYARLPAGIAEAVPRWLRQGLAGQAEPLKPPSVWRLGGLVVKVFAPPSVFGWVRPHRAVRSAERYFWCLPLRSPRPLVAAGRGIGGASLLVREHVAGELLKHLWEQGDGRAEDSLARFLARMARHGIAHGDLHPRNLLWNGDEWVLLDVDGLRHGLHDPGRVLRGQWARFALHLGDEERVRSLHRRATEHAGPGPSVPWDEVRGLLEKMRARRGGVPPV